MSNLKTTLDNMTRPELIYRRFPALQDEWQQMGLSRGHFFPESAAGFEEWVEKALR